MLKSVKNALSNNRNILQVRFISVDIFEFEKNYAYNHKLFPSPIHKTQKNYPNNMVLISIIEYLHTYRAFYRHQSKDYINPMKQIHSL